MDKTVDELLLDSQGYLDDFEEIHLLKKPYLPTNGVEALELSYEQLAKLSAEQCGEYSHIIAQYSAYIQRIENKEAATLIWLTSKLQDLVCNKLNDYDQYTRYEIKVKLIARENDVVKKLLQQINYTEQKLARLKYISTSITKQSETLNNLRQTKMYAMRSDNGR